MHIRVHLESIAIYLTAAALAAGAAVAAAQTPTFLPTLVTLAGTGVAGSGGNGGLATAAQVSTTVSTGTMDPQGNIYITDSGNNVIRKITPQGVISIFAGTGSPGYSGDGGPATSAEFADPVSVRYHQGALYVTDFTNGRIRRIDLTTDIVSTIVGGGAGALNDNTPSNVGTSIALAQPQDLAFDNLGNMYWSQGGGTSRVNVLNLATGMVYLFAGTGGAGGTGVNIGVASATLTQPEETELNGPMGLAVDAQNNVYIVEYTNMVIRKVTVGAVPTISTYAGIGKNSGLTVCTAAQGATDSIGDGCPAISASFGTIEHMSIDGAGNIYVADSTNDRIRFIPPNPSNPAVGGTVSTLIGTGTAANSPDGTYASAAELATPYDSQILPDGDLLIVNHSSTAPIVRLLHYPGNFLSTPVGASSSAQTVNVLTQAGSGTFALPATSTDFTVTGTPSCAAAVGITGTICSESVVFQPTLAGNRSSALQFTDANGTAVAGLTGMGLAPVASLLPGLTSTAAGTGSAGITANGVAASAATFDAPGAVTVDSAGNVYVADAAANAVSKFAPNGTVTVLAGTGTAGSSGDGGPANAAQLSGPSGVAVDATGNVYISDTGNSKIRMVSASTGNISTVAGTGAPGYTGDESTPAAAMLNAPMQIAWSPLGILYVADTGNSVIRAISLGEQLITTVAGNGTASFSGDRGPGQDAQLANPQGIGLDGSNNLYIADTGNNRIRELSEGYINTLSGQTGGGFNGDGPASSATLGAPTGVTADLAGNVYIADTGNNRIRIISSGEITTVMGTGTASYTGDGASSSLATVNNPLALALDSAGDVYIADTGNHVIRNISVGTDSLTFKTLNPGETSAVQTVTVYNSGNETLTVGSVVVPSGYIEEPSSNGVDCTSANTTPLAVTPGTSCNLNTVLNPPVLGSYNGVVSITDNAEDVAIAAQSVNVTGTSAYVFTPKLTLPSMATAGTAVNGTLVVNNPLTTYTGTVTFTSTDPQAVLPANYTFITANNGMLNLSVTFKTAGPQCVTVTDTTNSTITSTACSTVSAAAAAKVAVYTGNNQTVNVGTTYTQPLVAYVTDAYGNPVGNAPVVFTVNANGSVNGTFGGGSTTSSTSTDPSGYASSPLVVSGATVGTFTVTAALPGTPSTANFNLTIVVLGSFTIVPTSTQEGPVAPGITSTEQLSIITSGGFTAPITFTCAAPTGITCTAGPNPFTVATQASNPATVNFTSQGSLLGSQSGFLSPWSALAALVLGGLMFRRRRKLNAILLTVFVFGALTALSGCGTYYAPVTTNGTYTVTVTGTAQTVSASATITYTVQK